MTTLARLSFWVPPKQMDRFEAIYAKKLLPILAQHNLEESSERGRPAVEGVISRLFEVDSPAEIEARAVVTNNAFYVESWGRWGPGAFPWWGSRWYFSQQNPTRQLQLGVNTTLFALTQEGSITHRLMDSVRQSAPPRPARFSPGRIVL